MAAGPTNQGPQSTSVSSWLVLAWIVISTVFLTVLLGKMLETQWRLSRLRVRASQKTQSLVNSISDSISLWRAPKVYVVQASSQPFVFGWLRGAIYLPSSFEEIESAQQQTAILTHELAHVARWDAAINLVQMLVQALFFFHPAVWWANRKARQEREKCCDEFVLSIEKTSVKNYCEAIVHMLDRENQAAQVSQFQTVLAVGGSTKNIEERICTMLMAKRKFRRRPSLLAIVTLGLIAIVALPSTLVVTQSTAKASTQHQPQEDSKADGQEPAAPEIDWPSDQKMEFRVINAETKEPLPGVDLELQYAGKGIDFRDVKVQTTDSDGVSIIKLPKLPPKSMRVYPSKPGFVPLRVYWAAQPTPVLPKTVTIPLAPGKTIGGTVFDEDGKPLPGAKVSVHYWSKSEGKGHGESPDVRVNICDSNHNCKGIATSDKDGRWKLDVLPEKIDTKKFHLYFHHSEFISDHSVRAKTTNPMYESPSLEKLFDLSAETTMKQGDPVEGVVTNKDGAPVQLAKIFAFHSDSQISDPIATTGMDGEFKFSRQTGKGVGEHMGDLLQYVRPKDEVFLIEAKGYAPELIELKDDSPLSIQLKPGKTLSGRVVDEKGKPLEKAGIWADTWRGQRGRIRVEAYTDADGRFEVTDLPDEEVTYSISKRGMLMNEDFPMTAGAKEYSVTLMKPLTVKATVTDAQTGELIKDFTYMEGFEYEDGRAPHWRQFPKPRVLSGKFEKVIDQIGFTHRFRVEAEGYEPGISQIVEVKKDSKVHTLEIEFKLKKGVPLVGSAIGLDGKPLAGAKVILARSRINISERQLNHHEGNPIATTDDEGKFQFPPETQQYCLVVIHENGVGMITEKEMDLDKPIQIKPWDEKNKQMQIIRLPAEGQSSDFPKNDPFESKPNKAAQPVPIF